jgi:hypothetical protein
MQSRSIRRSGQPTSAIALLNASFWSGPDSRKRPNTWLHRPMLQMRRKLLPTRSRPHMALLQYTDVAAMSALGVMPTCPAPRSISCHSANATVAEAARAAFLPFHGGPIAASTVFVARSVAAIDSGRLDIKTRPMMSAAEMSTTAGRSRPHLVLPSIGAWHPEHVFAQIA